MDIITYEYGPYDFKMSKDPDGKLWFMAKNICDILEYSNYREMIKKHCREKGVTISDTLTNGGVQGAIYIDEGNLYRLMIKSNKPKARKFEAWVCDEVLPAIRRTGRYEGMRPEKSAEQALIEAAADRYDGLERVFRKTNGIVKRMGYRGNAAVIETCARVEEETGVDCIRLFRADHLFRRAPSVDYSEPEFTYEEFMEFIDEACELDPAARVGASVLYGRFVEWWAENMHGRITPSMKRFGGIAGGRFRKCKVGVYIYFGVRVRGGEL